MTPAWTCRNEYRRAASALHEQKSEFRRMLHSFDFLSGDIASTADDDLFPTSYEPMEAVCIATGQISGMKTGSLKQFRPLQLHDMVFD